MTENSRVGLRADPAVSGTGTEARPTEFATRTP